MQNAHAGRGRAGGSNEGRVLLALALVVTTRAAVEGSPNPVSLPGGGQGCPLLEESATSLETVSREEAVARMEALVEANTAAIARLDGRWRAGDFGPPGSRVAELTVRRLARADLVNWYAFMAPLAAAEEVRVLEPATVEEISSRFSESTVFPTPRMRHLLVGRGWVCARYDLGGDDEEGVTLLGGKRARYEVRDARVGGVPQRVLAVGWRSASVGRVEILFAEEYGFRLEQVHGQDRLGGYVLYLALDVAGAWVHRWGTHRPAGFAFWVTDEANGGSADGFRVGSALYVPRLRLHLPLLPDIGFDDLRLLAPPVPLLPVEEIAHGGLPPWLPADGELDLRDWSKVGDPPAAVREFFPDL